MSEKLCLQWNEFQENIKSAFRAFRDDNDFADVTLVCEDGQQMKAHKVVLAASSPFFQKLLGLNKHPHPLVFMRGMKSSDLWPILDFLYHGEANVFQESLDSFLAIAQEFQLRGLEGKREDKYETLGDEQQALHPKQFPVFDTIKNDPNTSLKGPTKKPLENKTLALPNTFIGDFDDLEAKVKSMMEKSKNNYSNGAQKADRCKVCGKEGKGGNIKDHIEANHLEGLSIPCNLCDKTFRSRNGLRIHNRNYHY